MEAYVIFWLAMIIFFIVLELLTIGLTSIWFAAGSIGGLIVAALGGNVFIQAAVFFDSIGCTAMSDKAMGKEIHKFQSTKDKCG